MKNTNKYKCFFRFDMQMHRVFLTFKSANLNKILVAKILTRATLNGHAGRRFATPVFNARSLLPEQSLLTFDIALQHMVSHGTNRLSKHVGNGTKKF